MLHYTPHTSLVARDASCLLPSSVAGILVLFACILYLPVLPALQYYYKCTIGFYDFSVILVPLFSMMLDDSDFIKRDILKLELVVVVVSLANIFLSVATIIKLAC